MSSYSVQRAAKNLEDTILDLEDFFVDPLVDFLYHKGVIKHEDALDVYDYVSLEINFYFFNITMVYCLKMSESFQKFLKLL